MISPQQTQRPRQRILRWKRRFADALDGCLRAVRDQESLWVHVGVAIAVSALGFALQIESWRWCAAVLAATLVISLELMNSAIEQLVKTLHPEHDAGLAAVLHMAAASVLVAAVGSVVIGMIVFVPPILALW